MATLPTIAATSLLGLLGLQSPPSAPTEPIKPAEALVDSPSSDLKGTMLMIHGGGWQGPGAKSQKFLMEQPGEMLVTRGWRVVSVDYQAGTAGITDVVDAAAQELRRAEGNLLCLYGESSGAQIALVVAARLKSVDCVVAAGAPTDFRAYTAGAPTDFRAYTAEAKSSGDGDRTIIASQIESVFGLSEDLTGSWEPVKLSKEIASDVLMLREADDDLMPREQLDGFLAARPTTESLELESNPAATPETWWLHGTLSEAGRARYLGAVGGFVDRAYATRTAERSADRTGCQDIARSDLVAMTGALRCLARNDRTVRRGGRARIATATRRLRGEINAARIWTALRSSARGRRALAAFAVRRASFSLRSANPSTVTLRGS